MMEKLSMRQEWHPANPHAADATINVDNGTRPVRRHRRLRRLACAAFVAIAALGVVAPANADDFGLDQPGALVDGVGAIPDNFNHTYCFDGNNWTTRWRNIVHGRMANLDDQTRYFDTFPLPATGCFATTDLWFRLDTTMAARGDYSCRLWNNGLDGIPRSGDDRCEGATIRINPNLLSDDHERRKTACHEIGHSVGLAHHPRGDPYADDCMVSGRTPGPGSEWERYSQHHIDHANSRTPHTD